MPHAAMLSVCRTDEAEFAGDLASRSLSSKVIESEKRASISAIRRPRSQSPRADDQQRGLHSDVSSI
eukprot:3236440-Pleurochrysis_carterae.AAC.1